MHNIQEKLWIWASKFWLNSFVTNPSFILQSNQSVGGNCLKEEKQTISTHSVACHRLPVPRTRGQNPLCFSPWFGSHTKHSSWVRWQLAGAPSQRRASCMLSCQFLKRNEIGLMLNCCIVVRERLRLHLWLDA